MGNVLKETEQQLVGAREHLKKDLSDQRESERESFKARIRSLRERLSSYSSSHPVPAGEHRRGLLVNEINLYTFFNPETFHVLLLHEMGHALGLPHTEQQPAIMHPVIDYRSDLSNLTPLDIQAALALCGS
jgi:predicted Zn-dependent protease